MLVGKENGSLDVWDLFDNLGSPSHTHLVSAIGVKFLEMSRLHPKLLMAGDRDGCLHLLSLPTNLYTKSPGEHEYFLGFIEKEKKRVAYYRDKLAQLEAEKKKKKKQAQFQERDFYLDVA